MRILHLIATLSPESGGPATACLKMAKAVIDRGHTVDIFTTSWGMTESVDQRFSLDRNGTFTFPVLPPRAWKYSPQLAAALNGSIAQYDLLHVHSLYLFHNWAGPAAALRARKPYIVRPHGLLDPYIWQRHRVRKTAMEMLFQNRMLRKASAVHYTSADEMRISEPYACGAPGVVVPLGVDLPDQAASADRKPQRILFLSRLHAKKGLDLLIPAFAQVKARFPDAELVIAGPDDGALRPTRALVTQHGLEASVSFPGMLIGTAKTNAFSRAGLFVLPSYSENFGIALAEAMADGLPVVTTDKVNIHDAVSKADAGIVVPCQAQSLANAMMRVLDDPALAARLGGNGRRLAATQYSWDAVGGQLEALYAGLIESARAANA